MIQNGDILGGMYQIIQEIGRGGTGVIYLAEHLRLRKKVIIKKIKENFVGQINTRGEVDILKHLHHTYLPQVYDFVSKDTTVYTVMEYIEGNDLQWFINQNQYFSEQSLFLWLCQLSEVLEYLHNQSPPILHSDIKPSNIMITPSGNICLIDFNISLDGEDSKDIQGVSAWYAAPEQFEKARLRMSGQKENIILDERMDLYSLGATFYTLMTGKLPNPSDKQFLPIIYMDLPYSEGLKAIIYKMMQTQPSKRFRSAEQVLEALSNISKMDPEHKRLTRLQFTALVGYVLCLIIGILCIYYGSWQNTIECWQKDYREFCTVNESQSEGKIVADGIDMLNSFQYKSYLKRHPEKKAEVLHAIGESYFREEDYQNAASYYQEAMEEMPDEAAYCQSYVIALVRNHQWEKALSVLQSSNCYSQMEQESLDLISAEVSIEQQNYEAAEVILNAIIENSYNKDQLFQSYLLMGNIYEIEKDYEKEAVVLEKAGALDNSRDLLRRQGQTLMNAASASSRAVNKKAYTAKAAECYQQLNNMVSPSYEDRLNFAIVLRACGSYQNSINILTQMKPDYPDDYKVEMWICYDYLEIAEAENSYDSVMDHLTFSYQSCKHMYQSDSEKDEDMENLIEIMNDLGV
ncbi:MAG: protein kinase [Hespellia sp.]|nr:protein kinase [Hespellia sp.]